MQQIKQVEVRMDESHLEGRADAPESTCSMVCDKIMKNMVLTLTILGKCSWQWPDAFTFTPYFCLFWSGLRGGRQSYCSRSCYRGADKHDHTRGRLTLTARYWGDGKYFQTPSCEEKHTNVTGYKWMSTKTFFLDVKVAKIPARKRRCLR